MTSYFILQIMINWPPLDYSNKVIDTTNLTLCTGQEPRTAVVILRK